MKNDLLKGRKIEFIKLPVTLFFRLVFLQVVTQVSIRLLSHLQWNLFFGTPPFKGHLYSGDAKFGPGKMFTSSLYLLLLLNGIPLFKGKGHFFWVPKPEINFHSEETLALKP